MSDDDDRTRMLTEFSRKLVDQGKLIEAGFVGLLRAAVPPDAPPIQIDEMRNAFFAGAQHLFASLMTVLDRGEDDEPSQDDLRRMDLIQAELQEFIDTFRATRLTPPPPPPPPAPPPPPHQLGDAPIEAAYTEKMNAIAAALDELFNGAAKGADRKTGFVLLVFPFGGDGRCNYISNGADRRDIVVLMKEQIARFEGQPNA
jgi:hypothetical protein